MINKIAVICVLFTFPLLHGNAQPEKNQEIIQEINSQIWLPFIQAYETHDPDLYNSIHSDDILRVTPWGIRIGEEYKSQNTKWMSDPDAPKTQISFRFEHRLHKESVAYEVGYYRLIKTDKNNEKTVSVGRFHVVLKKQDGRWKITQDWDTNKVNGHQITEEDYEKLNGLD